MMNTTHHAQHIYASIDHPKRHQLHTVLFIFTIFNLLPFIAPIAMQSGWYNIGNSIYDVYGLFCHQMAHRSYFLFSEQLTYPPEQLPIEMTGNMTMDTLTLRAFRGTNNAGWKVAWSDRMISMYGSLLMGGYLYWFISRYKRIRPFPIWLVILFVLPLAIDGTTHLISDFAGLTAGFRYTNLWLANLTGHVFPAGFYAGDTLGSFNSWMRIITGLLFGIGIAGFVFPFIDLTMPKPINK